MLPRRKDCMAPLADHKTSSSAAGSLTMEITRSDVAASSAGEAASLAPAATSSSARDAVRFQTVSGKPAFQKIHSHWPAHEAKANQANFALRVRQRNSQTLQSLTTLALTFVMSFESNCNLKSSSYELKMPESC